MCVSKCVSRLVSFYLSFDFWSLIFADFLFQFFQSILVEVDVSEPLRGLKRIKALLRLHGSGAVGL